MTKHSFQDLDIHVLIINDEHLGKLVLMAKVKRNVAKFSHLIDLAARIISAAQEL